MKLWSLHVRFEMACAIAGIHFLFLLLYLTRGSSGKFVVPGLSPKHFVKPGDINIGVMFPVSSRASDRLCSIILDDFTNVITTQTFEYAVDRVNSERFLPNNVTLGLVIVDDCAKEPAAAAQSMAFVPQGVCQVPGPETSPDKMQSFDVVAVIGSTMSATTVAIAYVLGPAQIPLISYSATSDELSNKELFPYFLRTVPPDRFQFRAIFSLIQHFGWTYVSVIYMEGSYGENGYKQLRSLFSQHGICLAAVQKVSYRITEKEASTVAADLAERRNARAVVIITYSSSAKAIINATSLLVPPGTFTWIASDGWASAADRLTELGEYLLDAFLVRPVQQQVPEIEEYFKSIRPGFTTDPWFPEFWDIYFECSLANNTCPPDASVEEDLSKYYEMSVTGMLLDTVYMLTNAMARVLSSPECHGLQGAAARACVTGAKLLRELKVTRQQGHTGWMELDGNGDRLGRYTVKQVVADSTNRTPFVVRTVGEFDSLTGNMTMLGDVTWAHHTQVDDLPHPESRCSWPCRPGEARVPQEVTCCWLCQPCRVNEYLAYNGTRCEACPQFTWPDPDTKRHTCKAIPPDTPAFKSVTGGVQTAVALACLLACVAICIFIHRHRKCRVVKASSRELSFLMLLAICAGYVAMITLITPPNDVSCRVNYLLFCLSFALIYGPLFVRALRIYRIFEAGKRSAQRPRMIDTSHQLLFSFGLFSVQALICLVVIAVFPTWHQLTMKVPLEAYVELSCHLPMEGLASFLAYNLLLLAACTYLAFKTRHLPDNFNESRFISMCVTTTLVIWLAFIPGYLLSFREHLKMLTLALALALNHTTALVFLFLPKVYAVMYLEGAADISATAAVGTAVGGTNRLTFGGDRISSVHVNGNSEGRQPSSSWRTQEDDGENGRNEGLKPKFVAGPNFSKIMPRP